MTGMTVRPARAEDRAAVDALHEREWGGPYVVAHDTRHDLRTLPTLVAADGAGAVVGALAYRADADGLEVVSVVAATPGGGVGTALLAAAAEVARAGGRHRLWLVTTNDNLRALRFYQRCGLRLVRVDRGAVDRARRLKPSIPMVGEGGIGLHDELVLELLLAAGERVPDARAEHGADRAPWISLTTDYGLADGFVAACHGVIARLAPQARIVDVTHLVPPADVRRGAAVLAQAVPHLPEGVHVAVVDPGVGTARRGVALATPRGLLVGPDNGLLVDAAEALGGVSAAVELTDPDWLAPEVSRTFHGRDVFAPVAARLALGAPLARFGPAVDPGSLVRLPTPVLRREADGFAAEVLTVDHFGNVQLAAPGELLTPLPARVRVGPGAGSAPGREAVHGRTFGDAPPGGLVVHADSAGRVAVAVNGGRAVDLLAVAPGDLLRVAAG
ncbi:S-adenosylmethionine hydrolase (SAM-hydroxide adenosyltransferase) [Micromonospora echinofusca]|uniref:S-adenosylmethionine hydrolase (SAM-hydroxide adenosyltransferase) n=1 Tax=Micromonospora echinofusca TaxID=47858 RepID=A0A1C5GDG8_MICEH|nr:S-adenosylmethionine hydrolase (SAM-hydroxide adenosyltransferase) [Micromonospora echinofusca]